MLAAALIALLFPAAAQAADRHEVVAGWTLDDVGGRPGDDSDRSVTMRKSLDDVSLIYAPSESGGGGSIQLNFKRCQGLSYGSGFGFEGQPSTYAAQVRSRIAEAFAEFAQSCPGKDQGEAKLMAGFDQAFHTLEAWVAARPFKFPREELPPMVPDGPDTPAGPDGPDDVPMI
jgi:opacity protein-like surface antigen